MDGWDDRIVTIDWEERARVNRLHELKRDFCGNCALWMKCTCPRERVHRPSSGTPGCLSFERSPHVQRLVDEVEA